MTVAESMRLRAESATRCRKIGSPSGRDGFATTLQLSPSLDRKPKQLSGGQRQRAAIGRAMSRNRRRYLCCSTNRSLAADAELRVEDAPAVSPRLRVN